MPTPTPSPSQTVVIQPTSTPKPEPTTEPSGIKAYSYLEFKGADVPELKNLTYCLAGTETVLENNRLKIVIAPNTPYSLGLLDFMDKVMQAVEEVSVFSFTENTNDSYAKPKIYISGGYGESVRDDVIILGPEYAIAEGGNYTWRLASLMAQNMIYRTAIPYIVYLSTEATSASVIKHLEFQMNNPYVFVTAYANGCADRVMDILGINAACADFQYTMRNKTFDELAASPEESFRHAWSADKENFAYLFYKFMLAKYGDDILFETMEEVNRYGTHYKTNDQVLEAVCSVAGVSTNDIFAAFKKWYGENKELLADRKPRYFVMIEDKEKVMVVPYAKSSSHYYQPYSYEYSDHINLDFTDGLMLLQIFGVDVSGISVTFEVSEGKHNIRFYDSADNMLQEFTNVDVTFTAKVEGSVRIEISCEGEGCINLSPRINEMVSGTEWYAKDKVNLPSVSFEFVTTLGISRTAPSIIASNPTSTPAPQPTPTPETPSTPAPTPDPSIDMVAVYNFLTGNYRVLHSSVAGDITFSTYTNYIDGYDGTGFEFIFGIPTTVFEDVFINEIYGALSLEVQSELNSHMETVAHALMDFAPGFFFKGFPLWFIE
jgi:hypothetical protein